MDLATLLEETQPAQFTLKEAQATLLEETQPAILEPFKEAVAEATMLVAEIVVAATIVTQVTVEAINE